MGIVKYIKSPTLLSRLHRYGITWVILFGAFYTAYFRSPIGFRSAISSIIVLMVVSFVMTIKHIFIPCILQRCRRNLIFFLLVSAFTMLWAYISVVIHAKLSKGMGGPQQEWPNLFAIRLIWFSLAATLTIIIYYQNQAKKDEMANEELKSEKLDMELRYLKSQINPHFLFNALNNIYSLVYTKDDKAADSVLKLSQMLRYVLVECQAVVIPLHKEVNYIANYIDFQIMTIGGSRDVKLEKDIECSDYLIAPMILQPIVENCFKYSRLDVNTDGFVHFKIIQKDGTFFFSASNSVNRTDVVIMQKKKSGIGLINVQKRLMLHYGKNYQFNINQTTDSYTVTVSIDKVETMEDLK